MNDGALESALTAIPSPLGHVQARIDAAVSAERERCARIVEHYSLPTIQTPSMWLVDKAAIANEIRNPRQ